MKGHEFLERQSKTRINGLDVYFPFSPYECQKDYMARVIEALEK